MINTFIPPKIDNSIFKENPGIKTNKILEEQNVKIEEMTQDLKSIRYENMKLNAQIELLNKTIDSQSAELERLQTVNAELKLANQNLESENRHYWRNTVMSGIFCAFLGAILGYIANLL